MRKTAINSIACRERSLNNVVAARTYNGQVQKGVDNCMNPVTSARRSSGKRGRAGQFGLEEEVMAYLLKTARSQARSFCRFNKETSQAYTVTTPGFWEAGLVHAIEETRKVKGGTKFGYKAIKEYIENYLRKSRTDGCRESELEARRELGRKWEDSYLVHYTAGTVPKGWTAVDNRKPNRRAAALTPVTPYTPVDNPADYSQQEDSP